MTQNNIMPLHRIMKVNRELICVTITLLKQNIKNQFLMKSSTRIYSLGNKRNISPHLHNIHRNHSNDRSKEVTKILMLANQYIHTLYDKYEKIQIWDNIPGPLKARHEINKHQWISHQRLLVTKQNINNLYVRKHNGPTLWYILLIILWHDSFVSN